MLFRAVLDAMDRWVTDGTPPPANRVPTRTDGTLVDIAEWRSRFPAVPGVATPRAPNPLPLLDFGPDAERGILREPPVLVPGGNAPDGAWQDLYSLVPAVDRDGNDIPGCARRWWLRRSAPIPVGTSVPAASATACSSRFEGSYIPFAETPDEREAIGDPRPSILERYPDKAGLCRSDRRRGASAGGAGIDAGGGC